jgi:hypothetical protein
MYGFAAALVLGSALCALPTAAPSKLAPEPSAVEAQPAEPEEPGRRVVTLGKVRLSHLQELSVGLGTMVAHLPNSYDCTTVCKYRGFVLEAEPGLGGGRISGGYGVVHGETGRSEHFLSRVYLAYGARGAVLRTWGETDLVPREQTLVGVEGDFTIIGIQFSLGLFQSLDPAEGADPWHVDGGIGWSF